MQTLDDVEDMAGAADLDRMDGVVDVATRDRIWELCDRILTSGELTPDVLAELERVCLGAEH